MVTPPYADHNLHVWTAGRTMDWHGHEFVQVIQVIDGLLEVDWGTGWQSVTPGRAHIQPPGGRHRLRSVRGHRQFGLNCTPRRDERGVIAALRSAFPKPCVIAVAAEVVPVVPLAGLTGETEPLATMHWQHLIDGYILALLGAQRRGGVGAAGRALLDHLQRHADGPILVDAVGRAVGLGRSGVQRLCRSLFGCGVAHVHERLRLDRAARRLCEEGLTVTATAAAAGYDDIFQFSRAFRRVKGLSPLAWQRQQSARTG